MPFNFFARGSGGFTMRSNGLTIGDVFEASDVASNLSTAATGGVTGVGQAAVEGAVGNVTSNPVSLEYLLKRAGRLEGIHLLRDGITMLIAHRNRVTVEIFARDNNLLLPDTSRHEGWTFSHLSDARERRDFIQAIAPTLEETNLNGLNVLAAIGLACQDFSTFSGSGYAGTPLIYFTIDNLSLMS